MKRITMNDELKDYTDSLMPSKVQAPNYTLILADYNGVYSGVTRYHVGNGYRYTQFILNLRTGDIVLTNLCGSPIKVTPANLTYAFKYVDKNTGLGSILYKATDLFPHGVVPRVMSDGTTLYRERVTDSNWEYSYNPKILGAAVEALVKYVPIVEQFSLLYKGSAYNGEQAEFCCACQFILDRRGKRVQSFKKITGFSKSKIKFILGKTKSRELLYRVANYVSPVRSDYNTDDRLVKQVDLAYTASTIVDELERKYQFNTGLELKDSITSSIFDNRHSHFESLVNHFNNKDGLKHVINYLYIANHTQGLSFDNLISKFSDYTNMRTCFPGVAKFPKYLSSAHDLLAANYKAVTDVETDANIEKYYNKYHKLLEYRVKGSINNTDYDIYMAKNAPEIADEATQQHNCVASYISSVGDGTSFILFMRKHDCPEKSFTTIELRRRDSKFELYQAYETFDARCKETSTAVLVAWCKKAGIDFERIPTGFSSKLEENNYSKSLTANNLSEGYTSQYHAVDDTNIVEDNDIQEYIR